MATANMLTALFLTSLLCMLAFQTVNAAFSCSFRCSHVPNLFDHMYPSGCYCHDQCGGKLRCCADKTRLCGGGFFSNQGGSQECTIPKTVRNAEIVGGQKLFYRRGESITYQCRFHYVLKGSARRTCLRKNVWTPGPPRCDYEIYICRPPTIRNGGYAPIKRQYLNNDVIRASCQSGYVMQGESVSRCLSFSWKPYLPRCIKDRCATVTHCSSDATCHNYEYYSKCRCNEGFTGDGWRCSRIPCFRHTCGSDEVCVDSGDGSGDYECECKKGSIRRDGKCEADPCHENDCHADATCNAESTADFTCECNEGFKGDGKSCEPDPCHENDCHADATCKAEGTADFTCECNEGFEGDGKSCEPDPCHENNCHSNAFCTAVDTSDFTCECNEGFKGNGTSCEPDPCHVNDCHANASCSVTGSGEDDYSCECNEGFKGNGTFCEVAACNPGEIFDDGVPITGLCDECEKVCCDSSKLRECRICVHMKCKGGEVCGEEGLSRVKTVCTDKKCFENEGGYTVETPDNVHCLDENGLHLTEKNCCWTGE